MDTVISIKNLTKSYGSAKAIDDLNMEIAQGEFFGFLGPNGAGKTTTIRILTGIIKADKGEVLINGFGLEEKEKIAGIIGVIPESHGFYNWMSAWKYLQFFADLYQIKRDKQDNLIKLLLQQVDLLNSKDSKIGTFSRGMRQRLGLARALINNPKILFLDEPTLGLDPQGQEDIQRLLKKLNQDGVTIFLSSHLLPEVSNLCSKIAIISKGKLVAQGTMDELRRTTHAKKQYYLKIQGDFAPSSLGKFPGKFFKVSHKSDLSELTYEGSLEDANELINILKTEDMNILEFYPAADSLTDIFLKLTK